MNDEKSYADLIEQETGHLADHGIKRFLRNFSRQVELFRAWGVWDRRSGITAQTREQVRAHTSDYLTGRAFMERLPGFAESLVGALTEAYQEGFDSVPHELIAQLEADDESDP